MASTFTYPGVYVTERESGARAVPAAATSIAMFVGMADKGPFQVPTRVQSLTEYVRSFGETSTGEMADQVRQFFVNGGGDAFIMRIADVQLSFPAILIALLIDGLARVAMPPETHDSLAIPVLILAIGVAGWVQYARTVRGSVLVEKNKEYVQAARVIGRHPLAIMVRHVLPNVIGPVLVIGTIHIATAIITEATLSFLGVGVPPTQPSLGTLIRVGNDFMMSGEWWISVFPGIALIVLVLSVNLVGDWLRDALNPKLR